MSQLYNDGMVMIEEVIGHSFIVRGYNDGKSYPEEFDWTTFVVDYGDGSLEVKAMTGDSGTIQERIAQDRKFRAYFKSLGYDHILYDRFKNGSFRRIKRKL